MTDENKLLISHINDMIMSVKKGRKFAFSSFLNEEQLSLACCYAEKFIVDYASYGGYDDAERCIIGFGADGLPQNCCFPITTLCFDTKGKTDISHRHVLGSLMSLGIKRECIGDIIFVEEKCIIFCDTKIADYICYNLTSVSNLRVDVVKMTEQVEFSRSFEEIICIVASMRLDCVVSELSNKSRTAASELIEGGLVFINGIQTQKKDKTIVPGEVISIRRVGKFLIEEFVGTTKKNRIKLKILKYI